MSAQVAGRVAHLSVRDALGEEQGSGTGFVISSDGRMATNFHVIDGADRIVAVFADKREAKVTGVWAFDKKVDLAVLQLEGQKFEPLPLAALPAHEGEEIFMIGSPLGLSLSLSTGIVSAVRERGPDFPQHVEDREEVENWNLQISAPAAPGSSGSPIVRADGEVVGVLVGHIEAMEGMHFGIPVAKLQKLVASAPARPRELNEATGVRSVRKNLLISGGVFAAVAAVWLAIHFSQKRVRRLSD